MKFGRNRLINKSVLTLLSFWFYITTKQPVLFIFYSPGVSDFNFTTVLWFSVFLVCLDVIWLQQLNISKTPEIILPAYVRAYVHMLSLRIKVALFGSSIYCADLHHLLLSITDASVLFLPVVQLRLVVVNSLLGSQTRIGRENGAVLLLVSFPVQALPVLRELVFKNQILTTQLQKTASGFMIVSPLDLVTPDENEHFFWASDLEESQLLAITAEHLTVKSINVMNGWQRGRSLNHSRSGE